MFTICHWLILVLTAALSPSFGELILHDAFFWSLCNLRVCLSAAYVASSCLLADSCRHDCETMDMLQKQFVNIFLHPPIFCTFGF